MLTTILWKRLLLGFVLACCIGLLVANGISRGPKSSPMRDRTLLADSTLPPLTRAILQRACRDCHSDNTEWPWYAHVPPVSWQIHGDVERGRTFMNFSKWSEYTDGERRAFTIAIVAAATGRLMPPPKYVWMHGNARLSDADLQELQTWAIAETRVRSQSSSR
jgi:hypothetical protein